MPIVQVAMIEGRSPAQNQAMYRRVTDAIHRTLGTPTENVGIMVYEVPPAHFATAGVSKAEPSGMDGS